MDRAQVVRRFEHEFENNACYGIVDELMSENLVHHLPYQGLPPGRAVGELVTGAIHDIHVQITLSSPKAIRSPTGSRQSASAPPPACHW